MFLQYPKASLKNGIIRIDHAQIREKCKCFLLIVHDGIRAPTTFKLEGEVTSLSESSQGEVGDNREKWEDFWEKLIAINRNIVSRPL